MPTNNLLIIGAGLSGLSAAYHLKKGFLLFEKESKPGGMASSDVVKDFIFDKTGHLLHFRTEYVKDLLRILSIGSGLIKQRRSSWVFSKGTYTRYPFQVNTYKLPPAIIKDCLVKMARAGISPCGRGDSSNFKEWILNNFGKGIARHFMFPYNRKLWKTPLDKIDIDWVDRFIPKTNFEQAVKGAVSDFKKNFGYNKNFYYPERGGIQEIANAFLSRIKKNVHFEREVVRINLKDRIVTLKSGEDLRFDRIISTIPLPELIGIVKDLPSALKNKLRQLRYVSIFNLNLGINKDRISDKHWVYFAEPGYIFYRVGFFSNISNAVTPGGMSSLYTEVSYNGSKTHKVSPPHLKRRIIEDLKKAGILTEKDEIVAQKSYDIKYAYPVHDRNREGLVSGMKSFLGRYNIYSIGRYGSWRYMTMEECILEGKRTAEVIEGG